MLLVTNPNTLDLATPAASERKVWRAIQGRALRGDSRENRVVAILVGVTHFQSVGRSHLALALLCGPADD